MVCTIVLSTYILYSYVHSYIYTQLCEDLFATFVPFVMYALKKWHHECQVSCECSCKIIVVCKQVILAKWLAKRFSTCEGIIDLPDNNSWAVILPVTAILANWAKHNDDLSFSGEHIPALVWWNCQIMIINYNVQTMQITITVGDEIAS